MVVEQVRQALLRQMGVIPWFARTPLPGAAQPHEQIFSVKGPVDRLVEDSSAGEELAATLKSQDKNIQQLREIAVNASGGASEPRPGKRAEGKPAERQAEEPSAQTSDKQPELPEKCAKIPPGFPVSQQACPPFAFSWLSLDEHLAVLVELPAGMRQVSPAGRKMLANIVAALHSRYQGVNLQERSFHWPFTDAPELVTDKQAALQAVEGFIASQLKISRAQFVLVLSEQIPFYLRQQAHSGNISADTTVKHESFGFMMLHTHALHMMQNDPNLKRSAWQRMQILVSRLRSVRDVKL